MSYTQEQIQRVCNKAAAVLKPFADVHNCTFPSTAIIKGMTDGDSPEEIGDAAFEAVTGLQPTFKDGYNQVAQPASNNPILNAAQFMRGSVINEIKAIDAEIAAATPTPAPTPANPDPGQP